ncbi:MAG TPA: hypothetical protein VFR78_12155 [Pyrinomonadaceae bacterium]|nr:hypothetical protein [Pyrinomonadaceae bacterium]
MNRIYMKSRVFAALSLAICWTSLSIAQNQKPPYGAPKSIATIKDNAITESSGLTASRLTPGAYWTHNDSGDGPFIYAFNESGASLGVFRVAGARAHDWEDMASGPGPERDKSYLYLGDIGDGNSARKEIVVYRVLEPAIVKSTKTKPATTSPAQAIRLRYPDGSHDAETLLVHPKTGNIYIVTKVPLVNAVIYEAAAPFAAGKTITMRRVGEIRLPSLFGGILTGGSISPDGQRVALCDYFQGYELVLPAGAKDFNEIWKQKVTNFDIGKREQGESITYRLDGKALLATSEGKQSPVYQVLQSHR